MDNPSPIQPPSPAEVQPSPHGVAAPAPLPVPDVATPTPPFPVFTWAALAVALAGSLGTVYLSLGMGLEACPLCLYQRMAVMGVASVLLLGQFTGANLKISTSRLVIPLAVAGLIVAGFHSYLLYQGKLECPDGLLGLGKPPYQSLAMFVLLLVALLADESFQVGREGSTGVTNVTGALLMGVVIGVACIKTGPPPRVPKKAYDEELKGCRVPFPGPPAEEKKE